MGEVPWLSAQDKFTSGAQAANLYDGFEIWTF